MFRSRENVVRIFLLGSLCVFFGFETYQLLSISSNMRPVADDYCLAGVANLGPVDYFTYWYTTFIADISTLIGNYFLIALPAVYLPYGVGTSFTFFACLAVLFAVVFNFINLKATSKLLKLISIAVVFYFVYLSWVSYWLVLGRGNSGDEISRGTVGDMVFFGSIMNWQAANINYVILPCAILLIYSKLFTKNFSSWNPLLAIALGFVAGGSFYVLSSTFILLISMQLFFSYFKNTSSSVRSYKNEMIVLVSAIISLASSYFSPGAQTRRLNYPQEVAIAGIPKTAVEGLFSWFSTLYFPAMLVTFLLGAALCRILLNLIPSKFEMDVTKFVITPFVLSLLTFVVTKVSELFAYKAWWHELSSRTYLFIATMTFGIYCMKILVEKFELEFTLLEFVVFASTIFIALYAVKQSGDAISERKVRWEKGPAQVTLNMDPFDRETPWVNECWMKLEEKRNS